jgi:DNA-binding transcriptional LysR family regulator
MARRHNKVSLDNLRMLDAIERHGSFAAAAQELFVVTSSITHAVHALEEQLGLTLFDRSGRRVRFTREGGLLLEQGRHLLAHAATFEAEVQLIATGWETSLVITLDQVITLAPMMPLVAEFFVAAPHTSLHLRREAVAGTWDALLSGRADLIVGAPAGGPTGGGFESAPMFKIDFVFAVVPDHPLARHKGVIPNSEIALHRSVSVGDTTRTLPHLPRGLLDARNILSVPDTMAKLDAILLGVAGGFLPRSLVQPHVRAGRLKILKVETPHPPSQSTLAWRAGENGRALRWWIKKLTEPAVALNLFF